MAVYDTQYQMTLTISARALAGAMLFSIALAGCGTPASSTSGTNLQVVAGQTVYQLRTLETTLDWTVYLVAFSLALELGRRPEERERFLASTLLFATVLGLVAAR